MDLSEFPSTGNARRSLDAATAIGLAGGLLMLVAAMATGGSLAAFVDWPSAALVVGGTIAVTTMSFSLSDMHHAATVSLRTMVHARRDAAQAAMRMLELAERARRIGTLKLETLLDEVAAEPFLEKGIGLVADDTKPEEIENILSREIQANAGRDMKSAHVLRRAAEVAPAMGLIGTLIGLVQMLGHLNDPHSIGPSMALALITTFYGAVLGNMILAPLATKLERIATEERLVHTVFLLGSASIARQENPRRLEMLLNSVLPPGRRVRYFD